MPNHVRNTVRIFGTKTDCRAIQNFVLGPKTNEGQIEFDFNKILPMPDELKNMGIGFCTIDGIKYNQWRNVDGKQIGMTDKDIQTLAEKHGAANWYDWAIKFWGTKWEAYYFEPTKVTKRGITYRFCTAWGPASGVYLELSKKFPNVTIKVRCSGEVDKVFTLTFFNGICRED